MEGLSLQGLQDLQEKPTYIYTHTTEWTLPVNLVNPVRKPFQTPKSQNIYLDNGLIPTFLIQAPFWHSLRLGVWDYASGGLYDS